MLYSGFLEPGCIFGRQLGPLRIGFLYGIIAVLVALALDLRFLFIDPEAIPDWVLTAIEGFRTQLALTAILFLGILAAIRTRPTRVDPDVPYRSLLLRDCVLADHPYETAEFIAQAIDFGSDNYLAWIRQSVGNV